MSDTTTSVLTAADRCDRCQAQAIVRHVKGDLTMDFCKHHDKVHSPALFAQGFICIVDNADALV